MLASKGATVLTSRRIAGVLLAALMFALAAPVPARAQDADLQEVLRYTLTEPALAKFRQATKTLTALPGACDKVDDDDDDDDDSESIDQMVAKLNAMPGAQAAIKSAGMSTREYVVFSWAIVQSGLAAWAAGQPGGKLAPGVSQANVDFYDSHEAELAALGDDNACEGDDGNDD